MIKNISPRHKIVYYLLLPSIITLVIFTLFPFFYNLWASVQNYDLIYPNQRHFIGINNFIKAITNEEFWRQYENKDHPGSVILFFRH